MKKYKLYTLHIENEKLIYNKVYESKLKIKCKIIALLKYGQYWHIITKYNIK